MLDRVASHLSSFIASAIEWKKTRHIKKGTGCLSCILYIH